MTLNNKKSKLLFFNLLKKESSLTYTSLVLSIFQRINSNVFSRQRNYTEYCILAIACHVSRKEKNKEKMSHVTVCN